MRHPVLHKLDELRSIEHSMSEAALQLARHPRQRQEVAKKYRHTAARLKGLAHFLTDQANTLDPPRARLQSKKDASPPASTATKEIEPRSV